MHHTHAIAFLSVIFKGIYPNQAIPYYEKNAPFYILVADAPILCDGTIT